MHYKLLSFQPCSLYQNGGCGRLLRRLYAGKEENIISIAYFDYQHDLHKGPIKEKQLTLFPLRKKWMRWRLRDINNVLQRKFFASFNKQRIKKTLLKYNYEVLHLVDQGMLLSCVVEDSIIKNKKLWVSFHDHFTQVSSFENTKTLWEQADRRMVISKELGEHYQSIFSHEPFEIITDGLKCEEIELPKTINGTSIIIYFGGLLHYHYLELFRVLVDALNTFPEEYKFKFIIRGAKELKDLSNNKVSMEYRNDFVSDQQIRKELHEADILYLPIKFTSPEFYKYSLSTKMIGYLGAPGTILYHGPKDSALCRLLDMNQAAVCCISLDVQAVINSIQKIFSDGLTFSGNAKELAKTQFHMEDKCRQFWRD